MVAFLLAVVAQTPTVPYIALSDGKQVPIRSFEIGTSDEVSRLKASKTDLVIVRFENWDSSAKSVAQSLKTGPNGRRIVMVEFPAMGASPSNGLLWKSDWDKDSDGKPDAGAPVWLKTRDENGVYPMDSTSQTLRNILLGPTGLVDKVVKAGFDGLVVSTVSDKTKKPSFDSKLVTDIMTEGRKRKDGFATFLRNPGMMMDFPAIRTLVDGFIADGLFYGSKAPGEPSDPEFTADSVKRLEWASKRLRIVLSIAYTTDPDQIEQNKKLAEERRFIPLSRAKKFDSELVNPSSNR